MKITKMTESEKKLVEENLDEIDNIISILWRKKFKDLFLALNVDEEDFFQEARLSVCENIHCFDTGKTKLSTFVTLIVCNKMRSYASRLNSVKRSAQFNAVSIDAVRNGIALADILPDKSTYPSFERETVKELFDIVSKEDGKIVKLFLCGYNRGEICKYLKISRRYMSERLKRMGRRSKEK